MVVYVFIRNKKTGKKKIVDRVDSVETARDICRRNNVATAKEWYEFTEDYEYAK